MASTGKYIHYRLPFILVVISFILISAWQFFLQRDIGAVFTWEWIPNLLIIPGILPLALLCLHKVRIKWLHSIFEALCIVTLIITVFYAVFGFLWVIGVSFGFIHLTYMPDFRASYIPINFYQLIVGDVAQLIPLLTNGLILIALTMTTKKFHKLSR